MSVVDEIKDRLDIVDVVSKTVALKKSGQSYTGFCPFHANTNTPSFVVFPHTQTWRCFGACADGGDIFSFVMKRDGIDFRETLVVLADQTGIKLEQTESQTSGQDERQNKLLELNAAAAIYFHNLLINSQVGATVRRYLAGRSLTSETITTFQLGYATQQRNALIQHFTGRGYTIEDLSAVGLITQPDEGTPYDRFRHRLMIPIRNRKGQIIGFGARALQDEQIPKYLNSPQTVLFDKSATLFGLDLARRHIRQTNQVVVVEGYMDVIQAYQRGARNVVAQMGTALTGMQLKQLATGSPKIVLALDSDAAGNAATIRSLSLARQLLPKKNRPTAGSRGINFEAHITQEICIVPLPDGQDPDDVLKQGLSVWQELLEQAVPALDFYERLILGKANIKSPQGKAQVVHDLIPIYREIGDEVEKTARVEQLARTIGLDERLLMAELKSGPSHADGIKQKTKESPTLNVHQISALEQRISGGIGLEEYCLSLILTYPSTLAIANDSLENKSIPGLSADDFSRGDHQEIFRFLQLWTASQVPKLDMLFDMVGDPLAQRVNSLTNQWKHQITLPMERLYKDLQATILQIRIQRVIKHIDELVFLQRSGDWKTTRHYTVIACEYEKQRNQLDGALAMVRGSLVRSDNMRKQFSIPNNY